MSELASESSDTRLADAMTLPRLAASGKEAA
ncbi:hypothetical protein HNR02_006120 [Amycolatopsis endophytica]|uniref:Uncharacterized protein n=1 Tax=Amycolatopsis endophytica TaxID=860233 RepID=A0A853BD97_9PSEU|nr:hypothetical protein [Amycolatopsis endophytica]